MDFKHGVPKMINPQLMSLLPPIKLGAVFTSCPTKEVFVPLNISLLRPHLEYAILANCPIPQKGHTPLKNNTKGSNEVGERS